MTKGFKKFFYLFILTYGFFSFTSVGLAQETCADKYPENGQCLTECYEGYSADPAAGLCANAGEKCCHEYAATQSLKLQIPLLTYTDANNIYEYFGNIYTVATYIIVPIAIIVIIFAGIQWISSAGSPGKIKEAKKLIMRAFIGLALALFSYVILSVVGITTLSLSQVTYINPVSLENQLNLSLEFASSGGGAAGGAGVGGKNAQEICKNIMKKTDLVQVYKDAEAKSGIEWEVFAGIHYRERNNATTSNPFQFDSRVNKYGKRAECRVWPTAMDCVVSFIKGMGTTDPVLIPRYYNCGKGCRLPSEYFYTHNDPDNGKIFNIKGTLENGQRVNSPDKRPGAVIIYNALKNNCGG